MRLVAFVWATIVSMVTGLAMLVTMVYAALDILWQLIVGSEGMSADSGVGNFLRRMYYWPIDNMVYAFFGEGEIAWGPPS